MTEDEAKTKWCPHTRNIDPDAENSVGNRYRGGVEKTCKCIASECMMWGWNMTLVQHPSNAGGTAGGELTEEPSSIFGHCGLVQ